MIDNTSCINNNAIPDMSIFYRDIVISTNTLIWRTDSEGRLTFLNPAWEKNFGYSCEEMLGRPLSDFQLPESAGHYVNAFRNCLIGEQIIGHESVFCSKTGDEACCVMNLIPLYDGAGRVAGTQGTAFDVSEQKRADRLLQYISAKDELTGLYNLHTFLSMAEQQIKTAGREGKEVLIICAGVDGMQKINDTLGHENGDQLLVDTANIIRKTFREADILARTGGDEFIVSTVVSSRETGEVILARLVNNIAGYNSSRSGSLKLSLSFGTAIHDPDRPTALEDTLSRADDNLHVNKSRKRG